MVQAAVGHYQVLEVLVRLCTPGRRVASFASSFRFVLGELSQCAQQSCYNLTKFENTMWCIRWAGAPEQTAEASAKPDVKIADTKAHEMDAEQPKHGSNTTNTQMRSQNDTAGFDQVPKSLHTTPGLQQRGIQQQQSHASR